MTFELMEGLLIGGVFGTIGLLVCAWGLSSVHMPRKVDAVDPSAADSGTPPTRD